MEKPKMIAVRTLTADAYAPFGYILGTPSRKADSVSPRRSFWNLANIELEQGQPHVVFATAYRRPFTMDRLERHRF